APSFMSGGGKPLPTEGRLSGRIETWPTPGMRPAVPHFSSDPCAKRPGWSFQALTDALLGRPHRSKIGKAKLERADVESLTQWLHWAFANSKDALAEAA